MNVLKEVRRAQEQLEWWREERDHFIHEAHESGLSYASIGRALGMTGRAVGYIVAGGKPKRKAS